MYISISICQLCIYIYIHKCIYQWFGGYCLFLCTSGLYYKIQCASCQTSWQSMLTFLLWFSPIFSNVKW